jgi:hypothetical protein
VYFSSADKALHVVDDTGADTALGGGGGDTATPFVVDATGATSYTTVQSAINAATTAYGTSGNDQVVLVRPGTYTENLTIKPGVAVVGLAEYSAGSITMLTPAPSTVIVGEHIVDDSGAIRASFSNVAFRSPAAGVLATPTLIQYGTGAGTTSPGALSFYNCLFDQPAAIGYDEKLLLASSASTAGAGHMILFSECSINLSSPTTITNIDVSGGPFFGLLLNNCSVSETGSTRNARVRTDGAVSVLCSALHAHNLVFELDSTSPNASVQIERSEISTGYGDAFVYSASNKNEVTVDDSCVVVDGAAYVFEDVLLTLGMAAFSGFGKDVYDPGASNFVYEHPKLHRAAHQGATAFINAAGPTLISTNVAAVDVDTKVGAVPLQIELPDPEALQGAMIVVRDGGNNANANNIIVSNALDHVTGIGSPDRITQKSQVVTYISMDISGGLGTGWMWVRSGAIK